MKKMLRTDLRATAKYLAMYGEAYAYTCKRGFLAALAPVSTAVALLAASEVVHQPDPQYSALPFIFVIALAVVHASIRSTTFLPDYTRIREQIENPETATISTPLSWN